MGGPGCRYHKCQPAPPVKTISGRVVAQLELSVLQVVSPPWRGSTSTTTTPLREPVATPILASGQRLHQHAIAAASVVPSWTPLRVRGCLPGDEQLDRPHEHL